MEEKVLADNYEDEAVARLMQNVKRSKQRAIEMGKEIDAQNAAEREKEQHHKEDASKNLKLKESNKENLKG